MIQATVQDINYKKATPAQMIKYKLEDEDEKIIECLYKHFLLEPFQVLGQPANVINAWCLKQIMKLELDFEVNSQMLGRCLFAMLSSIDLEMFEEFYVHPDKLKKVKFIMPSTKEARKNIKQLKQWLQTSNIYYEMILTDL